jgi:hypothetical protein
MSDRFDGLSESGFFEETRILAFSMCFYLSKYFMPYSQFTLKNLVVDFNLNLEEKTQLFPNIQPILPTELLSMTLQESLPLATAINSEKARSEIGK